MGAWGIGTFENDDAVEWLDELQASADRAVLQSAFEGTENGDEYLEAPVSRPLSAKRFSTSGTPIFPPI